MMWFCENSKSLTFIVLMAPGRTRLSPANSQHRPLFFWFVTFQSSRWCDIEWSVLVTIAQSSATSCTATLVTAFCAMRYDGSAAKSVRSATRSSTVSGCSMTPTVVAGRLTLRARR